MRSPRGERDEPQPEQDRGPVLGGREPVAVEEVGHEHRGEDRRERSGAAQQRQSGGGARERGTGPVVEAVQHGVRGEQVRQPEGDERRHEVAEHEDDDRGGGPGGPFERRDDERHEQQGPQDVREVVRAEQARGERPPAAVEQVGAAVPRQFPQSRDDARHQAGRSEHEGNGNA
ncbi:hypothetical protein ACFFQW_10710 [Umezawaea endophytica]|uniref:Uncharacterized protein n=1 Tax=Umezawaea endophytica TaxID=1654476 RepID=A0A9X3AGE6_9PSEU|nr:hypothetical protein [Umezawaea endophytica]MCS7478245.1 hypothetical protein [Umezawaea endophytica]